ncbi:MAG: DUF488 domain-containing protein [Pseudomonadota bacterium]
MARAIMTIGYEQATLPAVLSALSRAGVGRLVDVRAVAASRRPGFSKRVLAASLEEAGIAYTHLRALGTPKEGREAARAGRIAEMRRIFAETLTLPEAEDALAALGAMVRAETCALLCYEADAATCHRRMLTERLAAQTGLPVIDLQAERP